MTPAETPRLTAGHDALWWIDGPEHLGRISIWHNLAGTLAVSGHVGYDTRPSAHGRGHATAMLTTALPAIAALGIVPALITVLPGNHASRRVLEACGAELVKADSERVYSHLPTGG